ncbi:MAG: hypothetical protein B7Z66_12080 [Chromatiales bacterium 21-64-14]|nr:MAG: hypothetical protein B7Z66_12080 [Chromatiales bacterium 21-64-14]
MGGRRAGPAEPRQYCCRAPARPGISPRRRRGVVRASAARGAGARSALVVEISEIAPLSDLEQAAEVIQQLARRGIEVALDDLGTGHASLDYLQRLPAVTLKIDAPSHAISPPTPRT